MKRKYSIKNKFAAVVLSVWMALFPAISLAQEVPAEPEQNAAEECSSGCDQGASQGEGQGGPSLEDLGGTVNEEGETVLPDGVEDTRQGAGQGSDQGTSVSAANENTGSGSDNTNTVNTSSDSATSVDNTVNDATTAGAAASSGENQQNNNTQAGGITTGNAGIGVTQVKQDNTAVVGGSAGLLVFGYEGTMNGDLLLGAGSTTANLNNGSGGASIKATNSTTGSDSQNNANINTQTSELTEIQNDGRIDNLLDLAAVTGRNEANENTSDGQITTGNADVAATLINLLNTSVINGNIWVTVADIFGDLNGNIIAPALSGLMGAAGNAVDVNASNDNTGSDSDNSIDVDANDSEATHIFNDADINTEVNAEAITGQNTAEDNTGGGVIETGDASVDAANVTIANTTIEGGSWGLYIVNALNGWLGFLVGADGSSRQLSQEETLREVEASNSGTGQGSDNSVDVDINSDSQTDVTNTAVINNEINAAAVTGQNDASRNTGAGRIITGDASIKTNTVNIANTTVKDGSLVIAVVNIFGNWLGELIYDGSALVSSGQEGGGLAVEIDAENSNTGSGSENDIDVEVNHEKTTEIENHADVATTLNATVDTGSNKANRNTGAAQVETGTGKLGLFAHNLVNMTGISDGTGGVLVEMEAGNTNTGSGSQNTINARINDTRRLLVGNDANVDTVIGSGGNPATVNTGNNEANGNTLGAAVSTGAALADVLIRNIVNRVMAALAAGGAAVDAQFANALTGALSENSNFLDVEIVTLADILNDARITNLINLMLNTGGNKMNDNIVAGDLRSGEVCFDGEVLTFVNEVTADGQVSIDNNAGVSNDALIDANTGGNQQNDNTVYVPGAGQVKKCPPKVPRGPVTSPSATPSPEASPSPGPDGAGGGPSDDKGGNGGDNGGGEEAGEEEQGDESEDQEQKEPRVAAAINKFLPPAGGGILKRFPVAGGESSAVWKEGALRQNGWILFSALSAILLGWAFRADRRSREIAIDYVRYE